MAANYFLNIDENKIAGQSRQVGHEEEIEVLSFSFGVSQQAGFAFASGGGSAKANFQDLSLSFRMCSASPRIMKACAGGEHFDMIKLSCLKAAGENQELYLEIEMEHCIVSSYQTGGSGDDMPIESMSINFEKVTQKYHQQNEQGIVELAGTGIYDQATGVASE
jgi:type VI secretion system secreted protein Hcp